jgi:hypothetical protein
VTNEAITAVLGVTVKNFGCSLRGKEFPVRKKAARKAMHSREFQHLFAPSLENEHPPVYDFALAVSVSFLMADIDSPRGGVIRVQPQNLVSLSQTLHSR